MADININKNIEFAYVSQSITNELLTELEKRFLYQKILIIDNKYELSDQIDELIKKSKCEFVVVKDIAEYKNLEDIVCIIIVNCYNLNLLKQTCTNFNKPYLLALTKIFDTSILNGQIVDQNKKLIQCNLPLGVVLLKSKVFNKQDFICKFLLELVNFMFDNTQAKIDNLFFLNCKGLLESEQKSLHFLSQNIILNKNNEQFFNEIAKFYLVLCIKKSLKPLSLLDRVTELSSGYMIDNRYIIEVKYLFQCILSAIIKNFFVLWTKKLKSTLDIKKHKNFVDKYKLKCDFKTLELPEQKIEFLLNEFRQKLIDYVDEQIVLNDKIKSIIADINVDFLYQVFNLKLKNKLTDFICLEPDIYNKNSILKILSTNGLLNFDF